MTSANRYQRGDLIGKGGMGSVYRGLDTETGQPVALKFLLPDLAATNPEAVERFRREGEALRQLNHPNIVKFLDITDIEDLPCIVTELVTGGSLADLIKSSAPLPVEQVLKIALELADALTRAHHLNIIHRDIKPDNILLAEDGTPRLTDFGLARLTEAASLTHEETVIGTADYLSPEAIHSEVLDEGADIWSFGVTLFEMLTGIKPFRGQSFVATCYAIVSNPPEPDLEATYPDIPLPFIDLVYRMLEKDRRQRIPSVRYIGAELWSILRGVESDPHIRKSVVKEDSLAFLQHEVSSARPKHNLPKQTTPFIGRENELAALKRLLDDPNNRLVSIVGQGGMGKTRLALQTAETMLDKVANGVYFVPFAGIDSPQFMVSTIMDALAIPRMGMRQHSQYASSEREDRQLLDFLREKQIVLILDNLEQLLGGVGLLSEMLKAAPRLKILATTRERLNLQDEKVFALEGLAAPSKTDRGEGIEDYSAVQLFLDRATSIQPEFELAGENETAVVQICRLVEGMPLGIELAAAWLDMLSSQEIAVEIEKSLDFLESDLRDVPDRHRSMRALFDSTWQRLSDDERDLMMRLSVFRGGFTQQAATAVTGASLRTLRSLTNKSLLRRNEVGRYDIHELLRQYAGEHLNKNAETELDAYDRHSAYYLQLAETGILNYISGRQLEAIQTGQAELENYRSAWFWGVERKDVEGLLTAVLYISAFNMIKARRDEGVNMLKSVVETFESNTSRKAEILVGCSLMWQAILMSDVNDCLSAYQQGEALLHRHNARAELMATLVYWDPYNPTETLLRIKERIDISREFNDLFYYAFSLDILAIYYIEQDGDYESAIACLNEGLTIRPTLNDKAGLAHEYLILGRISSLRQEYEEAIQYYSKSLKILRMIDYTIASFGCIINIGRIKAEMGDFQGAMPYFETYLNFAEETGDRRLKQIALYHIGRLAYLQKDFVTARTNYEVCLSIARSNKDEIAENLFRLHLGFLELAEGNLHAARNLFHEVFHTAFDVLSPDFHISIDLAIGTAIMLALSGKAEKALELLYFTSQNPADKHVQDEQRLLAELEAELPADVVAAAKKRADELTLDEVIGMLWEELGDAP